MHESQRTRHHLSLLSRFGRIGAAVSIAAVVAAAPTAAWAGTKRHTRPASTSRSLTIYPSSSSVSSSSASYPSTYNGQYGWVIPLTFVYAPGYGPR